MRKCLAGLLVLVAATCAAEEVTWSFEVQGTVLKQVGDAEQPLPLTEVTAYAASHWGQHDAADYEAFARAQGPLPKVTVSGSAVTDERGEYTIKGTVTLSGERIPSVLFHEAGTARDLPVAWICLVVQSERYFGLGLPARVHKDSKATCRIDCHEYGVCTGRTVDVDGKPIPGQKIDVKIAILWVPQELALPAAISAADGKFELRVPAMWRFDLEFQGRIRTSHALVWDRWHEDWPASAPGEQLGVGDVVLASAATLKVRFVDAFSGVDARGVRVRFSPSGRYGRNFVQEGGGVFELRLPVGWYSMTVFLQQVQVLDSMEVRVAENSVTDLGDVKLSSPVVVKVKVVDESDVVVEGAIVQARPKEKQGLHDRLYWGKQGYFTARLDPSRSWILSVWADGMVSREVPLVLEPKDTEITVKLVREAEVEIRVQAVAGERAGLTFAMLVQSGTEAEQLLNEEGPQALKDTLRGTALNTPQGLHLPRGRIRVAPGNWILLALIEDEPEYYRVDLLLAPGDNAPVIIKQRGGSIRIRCMDGARALAGTEIKFTEPSVLRSFIAETDENGWIELTEQQPGTWFLRQVGEQLDDPTELEQRKVVVLRGDNPDATVDFAYHCITSVTFLIEATDCQPNMLHIWDEYEFMELRMDAESRHFQGSRVNWGVIEPGRYFALLGHDDGAQSIELFVTEFTVDGPGLREVTLRGRARYVSGKIDITGLPDGAEVYVQYARLASDGSEFSDGVSAGEFLRADPEGAFRIPFAGLCELRVQASVMLPDGGAMHSPAVLVKQGQFPQDLMFKPVAEVGTLVLELKVPDKVHVCVSRIQLRDSAGLHQLIPFRSQLVIEGRDAYLLPGVPVGKWDIVIEATGAQIETLEDVEISATTTAFRTLKLKRACELLIRHPKLSDTEIASAHVELLDENGNVLSTSSLYHRSKFAALRAGTFSDDAGEVRVEGFRIEARDRRVAQVRLLVAGYKPFQASVDWQQPGQRALPHGLEAK